MNNKDTGGPVFPAPTTKPLENYYPGMTLRDYFAAKAMQTFLSIEGGSLEEDARVSYLMADAMLKAREA